jgi:hypothetical protein
MGYYDEVDKAKTRIRSFWLPKVFSGEMVDIDEVIHDIETKHLKVGELTIKKYVARIAKIEAQAYDGKTWKK